MNKNIRIYFLLVGVLFAFNACRDMLDTDSSLIAKEEGYEINNSAETSSALNGLIGELFAISDRYVLMGELRGDLMTTSEFAVTNLQEVNNFQVTAGNEYVDRRAYYNIINNCNILLQKMDTTVIIQNEKVMLLYHVWTKTLRAWTYFQLGLTYGEVTYFTQPILDLDASLAQYPEMQLDELVDTLIEELRPYASSFSNYMNGLVPMRTFLGDLYLYKNDYRSAASLYYDEIFEWGIVVYDDANRWTDMNMEEVLLGHIGTYTSEVEVIGAIPGGTAVQNEHSRLVNLSYNDKPSILPSENYIRLMSEALYLQETTNGVSAIPSGDLRGMMRGVNIQMGDAYDYLNVKGTQTYLIFKYISAATRFTGSDPDNGLLPTTLFPNGLYIQQGIPIYRTPHLYLRFAEALNRLEKPTLAFAVLKYGLNYANVTDAITGKVNPNELLGEEFTQFPLASFFDNNVSMAGRGRGNGIPLDTAFFIIPELPTKQDSIVWVEDRILEELAAETPFEGNRFFDLLRVSQRRENHPAYMAEKVSLKYTDPEAMKTRLMNPDIWFLP